MNILTLPTHTMRGILGSQTKLNRAGFLQRRPAVLSSRAYEIPSARRYLGPFAGGLIAALISLSSIYPQLLQI